jgi:hypothetical protein
VKDSPYCRHCTLDVSGYLGCQAPFLCSYCGVCEVFFCECGNGRIDAGEEWLTQRGFQLPTRPKIEPSRVRYRPKSSRDGARLTTAGVPQIEFGQLVELLSVANRKQARVSFEHSEYVPQGLWLSPRFSGELALRFVDPRQFTAPAPTVSSFADTLYRDYRFLGQLPNANSELAAAPLWVANHLKGFASELQAVTGIAIGRGGVEISTSSVGPRPI